MNVVIGGRRELVIINSLVISQSVAGAAVHEGLQAGSEGAGYR